MRDGIWKVIAILGALSVLAGLCGCSSSKGILRAEMRPLALTAETTAPGVLKKDHFKRDRSGSISERDLRQVLASPVFLEADARLGVVPVATCYKPDPDLPLAMVPKKLSAAMEDSGLFAVTTEVSTDWPADSGISGLRELAARYRSEYLLLYRHRFIDRSYTNSWGWFYLTVLGIFIAPSQTMETDGVLEATLFDVKTGTLLFTVFERVHNEADENLFHNDRKRRLMKEKLLADASAKLAEQVVHKSRILAAVRPAEEKQRLSQAPTY